MTLDPLTLAAGYQFRRSAFAVTATEARAYLQAVDDRWSGYALPGAPVPPLLLIAKGLGRLMAEIGLPPGSIHGSQECAFLRATPPSTPLLLQAEVSRAATRQGQRFITVDLTVHDGDQAVCRGRALLIIPAEAGPGKA
jgi:hypothetical protein